jgi:cytochrome c oxidase cbb3-type subunit 4
MKQDGLQFFTDTHLTVLGLIIFFSYFMFMLVQVIKTSSKHITHLENIPFENNQINAKENV